MRRGRHSNAPTAGLILTALLLCACDNAGPRQHELTGATMGTGYNVKLVDLGHGSDTAELARRVAGILQRIESRMSTYLPESELSQFNSSPSTEWFEISEETLDVIEAAQDVSLLTGGAFDVTVGPLVNLWGFGPDGDRVEPPAQHDAERVRRRVGFEQLMLRPTPPAVRKARSDVSVDLSAIAKGYAVDRIADLLDASRVENYLVEVGGELRARGRNARGEHWTVAIERPSSRERRVQRLIRIDDSAVATSGDYRNYFEHAGRRYSHSIDPRTGRPVTHRLASVTVVGDSAMRVDALATAFVVMGPDEGFELATREGIAALFISRDGQDFSERSTGRFDQLLAAP